MPDPVTGKPVLECLTESHIFHLYVNLLFRTGQKSELMVLERHAEKVQYLRLSINKYTELVKLFTMMRTMLKEAHVHRTPEVNAQFEEFIESRMS